MITPSICTSATARQAATPPSNRGNWAFNAPMCAPQRAAISTFILAHARLTMAANYSISPKVTTTLSSAIATAIRPRQPLAPMKRATPPKMPMIISPMQPPKIALPTGGPYGPAQPVPPPHHAAFWSAITCPVGSARNPLPTCRPTQPVVIATMKVTHLSLATN